jgi:hypothetical protein
MSLTKPLYKNRPGNKIIISAPFVAVERGILNLITKI